MKGSRSPYIGQRGFTLIELVVVIAIIAMMTGVLLLINLSHRPGSAGVMRDDFLAAMTFAQGEAVGNPTGNGATLVITDSGTQTTLDVYDGRPNGYGFITTYRKHITGPLPITVTGQNNVATSTPIAIFIDSYGAATYQNWTPSATNLTSLPACTPNGTPLTISYDGGSVQLSSCAAKFTAS